MGSTTAEVFSRVRLTVFVAGCVLAVLAVSGVLNAALFTEPSTIKYAVTVAASVLVALLAITQAPLRALCGLAIVVAPFAFDKVFEGLHITLLLVVDVLAVLVWIPRSSVRGTSALRPLAFVFPLLLLPALASSDGVGTWVVWLAVTVVTGCLAFVVAREPGGPLFVASMLAVSAVVQAALAVWEFTSGHRLDLYASPGSASYDQYFFTFGQFNRPAGALPDPIGLGQVLALCIPMMVALAVALRRWQGAIAVLGGTALASVALLLSFSRMSMVGAAIGLVVTMLLLPRRALLRRGGAVAAMVVFATVLALSLGGKSLSQRIDSIFHPTASHVSTASGDLTREQIWHAAIKTAEANLLAGVGLGNVARHLPRYGVPSNPASHAHDTYLQFFAEGGVLALLGLLGLLGAAVVDLFRGFASNRIWVAGAAGSLVATMLAWVTDVEVRYLQVSAMVAVLLGLIAALGFKERHPVEPRQRSFDEDDGPATLVLDLERPVAVPAGRVPVPASPAARSAAPATSRAGIAARASYPPATLASREGHALGARLPHAMSLLLRAPGRPRLLRLQHRSH
jgi:O-Antigen ligase